MPMPNVLWPEAYCFCSVRPCVHLSVCASRNIVNTMSYTVFDIFSLNLRQWCITRQKWTLHSLWSEGQRSWLNKVCWKQHFLGLLTPCLEKCLLDFHQTYTNDVLWDRDECIKFLGSKVKVQGNGGITYAETVTAQAEAYCTRRLVSS